MEDLKNCMLGFLKQQEILRKQKIEKFQKHHPEDLEKHRKERLITEKQQMLNLTLTHYDRNKEIYVVSDASIMGLGVVLL